MTETHRFADEWILRAIQSLPGINPDLILTLRDKKVRGLADALIDGGQATRNAINEAIKTGHKVNSVELGDVVVDRLGVALFSETVCQRLRVFPIRARETVIEVALSLIHI